MHDQRVAQRCDCRDRIATLAQFDVVVGCRRRAPCGARVPVHEVAGCRVPDGPVVVLVVVVTPDDHQAVAMRRHEVRTVQVGEPTNRHRLGHRHELEDEPLGHVEPDQERAWAESGAADAGCPDKVDPAGGERRGSVGIKRPGAGGGPPEVSLGVLRPLPEHRPPGLVDVVLSGSGVRPDEPRRCERRVGGALVGRLQRERADRSLRGVVDRLDGVRIVAVEQVHPVRVAGGRRVSGRRRPVGERDGPGPARRVGYAVGVGRGHARRHAVRSNLDHGVAADQEMPPVVGVAVGQVKRHDMGGRERERAAAQALLAIPHPPLGVHQAHVVAAAHRVPLDGAVVHVGQVQPPAGEQACDRHRHQ